MNGCFCLSYIFYAHQSFPIIQYSNDIEVFIDHESYYYYLILSTCLVVHCSLSVCAIIATNLSNISDRAVQNSINSVKFPKLLSYSVTKKRIIFDARTKFVFVLHY